MVWFTSDLLNGLARQRKETLLDLLMLFLWVWLAYVCIVAIFLAVWPLWDPWGFAQTGSFFECDTTTEISIVRPTPSIVADTTVSCGKMEIG